MDIADVVQAVFDALSGSMDVAALAANCDFSSCVLVLKAEFTDSGTFILGYDSSAFVDPFLAALKDGFQITMEDTLRQSLTDNGISMEEAEAYYGTSDIDEMFAAEMGISIGDYFDSLVSRDALISMYDSMSFTGAYNVEDGDITLTFGTESETAAYDSDSDSFSMSGEGLTEGEITFTRETA